MHGTFTLFLLYNDIIVAKQNILHTKKYTDTKSKYIFARAILVRFVTTKTFPDTDSFQLLCFLCLHFPVKSQKREIEMKQNQTYETDIRAQPATQVTLNHVQFKLDVLLNAVNLES